MNQSVVNGASANVVENANNMSSNGGETQSGAETVAGRASSVITVTSDGQAPTSTAFYVPLNGEVGSSATTTGMSESVNINKIQVLANNNNNNTPKNEKNETMSNGTINEVETSGSGLVRRLSVTARPGDIFYKVKDVTESCSTTDGGAGFENTDDMSVGLPATNNTNPAFESEPELVRKYTFRIQYSLDSFQKRIDF